MTDAPLMLMKLSEILRLLRLAFGTFTKLLSIAFIKDIQAVCVMFGHPPTNLNLRPSSHYMFASLTAHSTPDNVRQEYRHGWKFREKTPIRGCFFTPSKLGQARHQPRCSSKSRPGACPSYRMMVYIYPYEDYHRDIRLSSGRSEKASCEGANHRKSLC